METPPYRRISAAVVKVETAAPKQLPSRDTCRVVAFDHHPSPLWMCVSESANTAAQIRQIVADYRVQAGQCVMSTQTPKDERKCTSSII